MSRSKTVAAFIGVFLNVIAVIATVAFAVILFGRGWIWAYATLGWEGTVLYIFAIVGVPLAMIVAHDDTISGTLRHRPPTGP